MDNISIRGAGFRKQLFDETAARMNLPPSLVEKDFWVCWTLRRIFELPEISDYIIFKGGTTLSKVHGVIERFSEDIDLTIHRSAFGFEGDRDPANAKSRKRRDKILEEQLKPAFQSYIQNDMRDSLYTALSSVLRTEEEHWSLDIAKEGDSDEQTLLFAYPRAVDIDSSSAYVEPAVRLEFGSRGASWPTTQTEILPYAAEYFPHVFTEPTTAVCAMTAERTFWEKATILHLEANRLENKPMPGRCSRHYYDMAMLANSWVKTNALQNIELLTSVVEHKKHFFRCGWAQYDKARPGTLCLCPPDFRLAELRRDYRNMAIMIFHEAPALDVIRKTIVDLEQEINQQTSRT